MNASIERATWTVNPDDWHYKFYTYWRNRAAWTDSKYLWSRENLCHYVRVVCIWAPLFWFFGSRWKVLMPWQILPIGAVAAGFLLNAAATLEALEWIGFVFGVFGVVIGVAAALAWLFTREKTTLAGEYIAAKKAKVCPFINLPQ